MPTIISVTCNTSLTPPEISIIIDGGPLGPIPFNLSTAAYELLRESLGLPENPCAGIG